MSINQQLNTPYYILNTKKIKNTYTDLYNAFKSFGINGELAYSIKANYNKEIICLLNKMGCKFEVCSYYEFQLLKDYGILSKNIILNGHLNIKNSLDNLSMFEGMIILGSKHNVEDFCSLINVQKQNIKIGLRLNLDFVKKSSELFFSQTSHFGIPSEYWDYVITLLKERQVNISCVQAHFSGNTRNPAIYSIIINELCKFIRKYRLNSIEQIDIGGGFKIGKQFWDFNDYIKTISKSMLSADLINMKLIVELGNSIVRESCTYCSKVIDTYSIGQKNYVLIDGSSLHLYGPGKKVPYEYKIESLHPISESQDIQYIVGNTCKESDCIMELTNAQRIYIGDIIKLYNVGAYTINNIPSFILPKPNLVII